MEQIKKAQNVISANNVRKYIDETADGGYWYKINGKDAYFTDATKKALKMFGFESKEAMLNCGKSLYDFVIPVLKKEKEKKAYEDFISGKKDKFSVECIFKNVNGANIYGEVFLAKSLVFEEDQSEQIIRAMYHTFDLSEAVFRQAHQLIENISGGIAIIEPKNGEYKLIYGNEGFSAIFNFNKDKLPVIYGFNILTKVYEQDFDLAVDLYEKVLNSKKPIKETYRFYDYDNNIVWIKGEHKSVKVGEIIYIYVSFMNVTEFVSVQKEVEKTNERLADFVNNTPIGLTVFDEEEGEFKISSINMPTIEKINELDLLTDTFERKVVRADFDNISVDTILKCIDPLDKPLIEGMLKQAEVEGRAQSVLKLKTKSKKFEDNIWINCKLKANRKKNNKLQLVASYEDITKQVLAEIELKKKQEKINNMRYHDGLTNILNRQSYNEFLKARGKARIENVGVAFVDINGLKIINDTYGHSKGDDTIKLTVMLIEHYFDHDEIYRLSGDNFVVIKEDIDQDTFYSKMEGLRLDFDKYDIASLGFNWNKMTNEISHEIDKAEAAERVAKQNYYATHLEDESKHRPVALNELMADIKAGRYVMYIQPKAYTDSKKVVAGESLIRKYDANGGIMSPVDFVPALEKERLVQLLDFFMLEETCKTIERWNKEGRDKVKISVNMSRVTLAEPDYIGKILNITEKYEVSHSQIEFEITESTETMDRHKLAELVEEISNLGFGVSLDDMGTEYSSVMMLAMEGIDTVKIDRGFILQMETEKGQLLVQNLIRMCHDLGEICIAEGVEDDETRLALNKMGCDMYQGYLLAMPIPVKEFEALLG